MPVDNQDDFACLLVDGWPDDLRTCVEALVAHGPADLVVAGLDLGNVDDATEARLSPRIAGITLPAFTASLNVVGYWPKPGILWLGPDDTAPFDRLNAALRGAASDCRIAVEKRNRRVPHSLQGMLYPAWQPVK